MPDFVPAPGSTATSAPSPTSFLTVSGVAATRDSGSYTNSSVGNLKFFRVARTSLAIYDPVASVSGGGVGVSTNRSGRNVR